MDISPRLKKIAELIPQGSLIADVGTDHAYIPVYCFQKGIIKRAIAMDVNSLPLKRAESNLKKYGFLENSSLRLSDGLEKLLPGEADVIVIAGMGGLVIKDIIRLGKNIINYNTLLIIQPMIAQQELREYLFSDGFNIENEYVIREENKFYNIFTVKKGKGNINDETLFIGNNLKTNSDSIFSDYLKYKLRICNKIISGMEMSENPDMVEIEKRQHEKSIYQKFLEG